MFLFMNSLNLFYLVFICLLQCEIIFSAMKFKEVFVVLLLFFVISVQSNPTLDCGKKNGVQGNVYGGDPTKPNTWPWIVAFLHRVKKKKTFFCGGSLVSAKHVVSGKTNNSFFCPSVILKSMSRHLLSIIFVLFCHLWFFPAYQSELFDLLLIL